MYLVPLIRTNRAIAASLIYPEHPIQAIAISEVISVLGPFFNPNMYNKIIGIMFAIMYMPNYSSYFLNYYYKQNLLYDQAEICTILLFVFIMSLDYI
tara:strand:+ start:1383 stop:1673 length:291 start_codon:yes stop_codon:yes gene_type:complete